MWTSAAASLIWRLYWSFELLLSKGANCNDKDDDDGYSPIILASSEGHVNIVELLLSKGANINDKDKYGSSPIIYASR